MNKPHNNTFDTIFSDTFDDNISITDDFMFYSVMQDPLLCKEVLARLLPFSIQDIQYVEPQKTLAFAHDSKSVRLDVYVADDNGVYDIEMQVLQERNLAKRARFYSSIMDMGLLEKGASYDMLRKNFVIFICTFDPFKKGLSRYTFENTCQEDASLYLEDGTYKLFFNTKAYTQEQDEKTKNLLAYMHGTSISNDAFIALLQQQVATYSQNTEWRKNHMIFNMREREIAERNFAKGMLQGKEEGILIGEHKGKAEGILIGEHKGKAEAIIEIVTKLLGILDDVTLARKTDLSLETIQALRQKHIQ